MKAMNQAQMKRLTAVHGWSGVLLGFLLYAVIITGTVVVLAFEISEWSKATGEHGDVLANGIDRQVRPALDILPKGYLEEVTVSVTRDGNLSVFAHTHATNPDTGELSDLGALFIFDGQTGERLVREEGFRENMVFQAERNALRDFLVDLHVQLYVPAPWGLILTGILGLAMMAAGTTGLIIHRHLIKDMFVPERPGKRIVSARDRHNLAATWSLPFTFILGLTGAFFSFALSIGIPLLAMVAFGGDQVRMIETLMGGHKHGEERRVEAHNLDQIIAKAMDEAGTAPNVITISNWGFANAEVVTSHGAEDGALFPRNLEFSGTTGEFNGERPIVGTEPSAGNTFVGLMIALHFGSFAGLLSKVAWVALGAAMCFVTYTGMQLWIKKREDDPLWQKFGHANVVVAYGLPVAMLGSAVAFFIAQMGLDEEWWTGAGFVVASLICILLGWVISDKAKLERLLLQIIGILCLAMPVLRMATGGPGTFEALGAGYDMEITMLDILFTLMGAGILMWTSRKSLSHLRPAPEPAE